jgi:hypothetical protein
MISLLTLQYGCVRGQMLKFEGLCGLFDGSLIPARVLCEVSASFFQMNLCGAIGADHRRLRYLEPLAVRMREAAGRLHAARWSSDFEGFFVELVRRGRFDSDASYAHPVDLEVSLSRCLFNPHSALRRDIDAELRTPSTVHPDRLVAICFELMPNRRKLSPVEQSIGLVVLFRALFNRCYELNSRCFAAKPDPKMWAKLQELSRLQVAHFPLPAIDRNVVIGDFFSRDRYFRPACQFLAGSIFESNPIDALYAVHKCLGAIQTAAVVHRNTSVNDRAELLCFDDLFSLLVGVLLATGDLDVVAIGKMISDFAPKSCLSPSFEYAQSSIEALVIHCTSVTVDEIRAQALPNSTEENQR